MRNLDYGNSLVERVLFLLYVSVDLMYRVVLFRVRLLMLLPHECVAYSSLSFFFYTV